MHNNDVSMSVISRLPRYYRYLQDLEEKGVQKVSSRELASLMGLTASQVRQDFNHFGGFGLQGYGYSVPSLKEKIEEILELQNKSKCILVGAGNLGRALLNMNFRNLGFDIVGVFDIDDKVIGTVISGHTVYDYKDIDVFCNKEKPVMAIITTPYSSVEEIASKLKDLGIRAFWNFSHYRISKRFLDLCVENVHLNDSLMTLSYLMKDNGSGD